MDAPAAVGPAIDSIFTERCTMAAIGIAEYRLIFGPHARPWHLSAAMTYQAAGNDLVFGKIPDNKPFNT